MNAKRLKLSALCLVFLMFEPPSLEGSKRREENKRALESIAQAFLFPISYFLFISCFLFLVSCFLLFGSCYLVLVSFYLLLTICLVSINLPSTYKEY